MKKRFLKLFLFVLCLIPFNIKAYEYEITNYDVNINVNENNTFNIQETIGTKFNISKHGIYRKIPLKNKITRLDGTSSTNRTRVSDVSVNDSFSLSKANGYQVIKIGNANYTVTGNKSYEIKYNYNLGKDPSKDYDELYFNIIGSEWDTTISEVTFTITMPKEFDSSKLGFSYGKVGSVDSSDVYYTVNENVITGYYLGTLNPGEALTVRLELPEGYFVGASSTFDPFTMYGFIIPIIFVVISFIMWIIFGKDSKTIQTVEFYPPEGFNSAEVGFLYKGKATGEDVVSLIIYLANKGYLSIEKSQDKTLFITSDSFALIKGKEYDGNNEVERIFLQSLFMNGNRIEASSLKNKFYVTVNEILSKLNKKENKNKIFYKNSLNKGIFVGLMILATFILITAKPIIEFSDANMLIFALLFPGVGFTVLFSFLLSKSNISLKIFGLIWGGMFGGIPWLAMVLPALLQEPIYLLIYFFGLGCIVIMIILLKLMPKRTQYGVEILGKIQGFKAFLEYAEKEKLEAMVLQNPSYFYDILPYTYVLGVSDKWIKKFESIITEPPTWYSGSDSFSVHSFGMFMSSTMTSANSSMTSSPSSSGGHSGGGHSGGGSGGGGGGSW